MAQIHIITHLHNDHCQNDIKSENTVFFCHPHELETIHNPHPLGYRYRLRRLIKGQGDTSK